MSRVRSLPRTTRKLVDEADQRRGDRAGDDEPRERLAPAVHREEPRRVRADAEERGVAERDDAGVAEDQVEREREERRDQDLAAEHAIAGEKEEAAASSDQPEDDLRPARLACQAAISRRLPKSPAGNAISSTTIGA